MGKSNDNQFRLLVSQMHLGLAVHEIICDKEGVPVDYQYISVNKRFEEQTGLKAEDIIGKTVLSVLPNIEKYWIETFGKVALSGEPLKCENYAAQLDKYFSVSVYSPQYGQFVVIVDDITEQKILENELYIEKELFKTTLLSVADGVISTDNQGNIKVMNTIAEKLTGWTQKEALGRPLEEIFTRINTNDNTLLVSKMGKEISIEENSASIKDSEGEVTGIVIVFRDYTEKKEKEKQIEYLSFHDHLTGLYNRRYMEDAINRLDTERNLPLTIMMLDVNGLKLTNDIFGHTMGDQLLKSASDIMLETCREDDIICRIGGDEFAIIFPNTDETAAEKIAQRIEQATSNANLDLVIVSLAIGYSVKTRKDESIETIKINADHNMYKNKLKTGKIMRSKTIEKVLFSINHNYDQEQTHMENVSKLCEAIARALKFTPKRIEYIKTAAMLHDIGKIIIPLELLSKTSSLTAEEFELIKQHSEVGYQMLKSVEEFESVAEIVRYHHERWDGQGYGCGLKGTDIPLESRIIAVADAYETMISKRIYKKSKTKEEVVTELKENAGSQFDPNIVTIFIEKVIPFSFF